MIYKKWSNPIGCKELWLAYLNHATVKLDSSVASRRMKTYSEARIELRNLQFFEKMLEKSSQFLSLDQPNKPKRWKNTLGKLAIAVNLEAIRFEFWTERSLKWRWKFVFPVVPCGRWFSNQFEIVSKTPFSCDTVGRKLFFTRCCAVKRTGTLESESNVMCLFYLILRSGVLMFRISNINQCVKNFLRLRKVEFIKWINLINVLFIGFVKQ